MEILELIDEQNEQLCKLCDQKSSKYTCPKCGILYCSLDCYKSQNHLECSENFYKQCIEDELKTLESNSDSQKKMIEILQRVYKEIAEEDIVRDILQEDTDEDDQLDSDDDEAAPDLAERLKNINLDNADELWSVLTDAERQEFEASVSSGDVEKLVPQWEPWWTYAKENNLVVEVNKNQKELDYIKKCPVVMEVPKFNKLSKVSHCVQFNLQNILYAYIYMALYFNGEHVNSSKEAVHVFLDLCDNMRNNTNFNDVESAGEAVLERIINSNTLPGSIETLQTLKKAINIILKGPEKENKCFYIVSALSDIYALFKTAKHKMFISKSESNKTQFPKKFLKYAALEKRTQVTKKDLQLHLKKLEYYLSWVNYYGVNMCS